MSLTRAALPLLLVALAGAAPAAGQAWSPDAGPGRYRNPIIFADYSDPDVVRVGGDFYMTASSFGNFPALPILHSRDLVHWTIVNHAIQRYPDADFDIPQHGNGVWAPSIRHHDGAFYIYWGDPDRGIYMVKTRDVLGEWDPPVLVHAALGWIDATPLWDDDGKAWLVHAFANSRAGIKSVLHIAPLSPDGTRVIGEDRLVFDGRADHPTIEGPKLYKHEGWYWIFAPAGGVATGWQTVMRSRDIHGPYEERVVLAQGDTRINGPHQGAWIRLENGDDWFIHFQDRGAYGRIIHLQPMRWVDGWPVIGADRDGDGTGEPVLEHAVPATRAAASTAVPRTTDEFDRTKLGLQWQWQANPRDSWYSLSARSGWMRLSSQPVPAGAKSLWPVPSLLLQKLPAPAFTASTVVAADGLAAGETAGLLVMGLDYAYIAVRRTADGFDLVQARAHDVDRGGAEQELVASIPARTVHLRVRVAEGAVCSFEWSRDGRSFTPFGEPFSAREGKWIGAKVGLFAVAPAGTANTGHADFDYLRIEETAR